MYTVAKVGNHQLLGDDLLNLRALRLIYVRN